MNLLIHPASQQSDAFHAHLDERERKKVGEISVAKFLSSAIACLTINPSKTPEIALEKVLYSEQCVEYCDDQDMPG